VKQGLLHRAYVYHKLKPVPEASNNCNVLDLQDAFEDWRSLPKISECVAARFISSVGAKELFTVTAGGVVSPIAVRAERLEGFAAPVATGIANNARIHTIKMTKWLLVRILCFIRFLRIILKVIS
jgi:hypothetical protein